MSTFILKCIAVVTMLIDHIGVTLVDVNANPQLYLILRGIGRIAFPIFAFLLVEGFFHTSNVKKYVIRLFIFALISEIPFDMMVMKFNGAKSPWELQNIFFTLLFGMLLMIIFKEIEKKYQKELLLSNVFDFLVTALFCVVAFFFKCDYGFIGILLMAAFYLFRGNKGLLIISAFILFRSASGGSPLQLFAILAYIPIFFYNGQQGKKCKYFFYVFYPAHLLVLFALGTLLR